LINSATDRGRAMQYLKYVCYVTEAGTHFFFHIVKHKVKQTIKEKMQSRELVLRIDC